MNFLDTYDIAGSPASTPQAEPEQSLNEEVNQVIGQLGRFWGGFRKQSQAAIQSARKDLGDVVIQAQKEIGKLTASTTSEAVEAESREVDEEAAQASTSDGSQSHEAVPEPSTSTSTSSSSQTFLSRLSSAVPPNIVATVQSNTERLKQASESVDFGQMRNTLLGEIQRVQDVTRVQAEEYRQKSEVLLREAGEVLRDAVKIIPPEESSNAQPGLIWDGSDIWMLPNTSSDVTGGTATPSDSAKAVSGGASQRPSGEAQRAVATRAESLLRRLKQEPAILRHDPENDPDVKERYLEWIGKEVEATEGGVQGQQWSSKIASLLQEPGDGQALQATHDVLVSAELTSDVFWKRFFFRVHQIEQEEEKRKALLQRPVESEDDFSWEEDEEEGERTTESSDDPSGEPPTAAPSKQKSTSTLKPITTTGEGSRTSTAKSPRQSSDEGYDVVSANASSVESKTPDHTTDESEDADSDWE